MAPVRAPGGSRLRGVGRQGRRLSTYGRTALPAATGRNSPRRRRRRPNRPPQERQARAGVETSRSLASRVVQGQPPHDTCQKLGVPGELGGQVVSEHHRAAEDDHPRRYARFDHLLRLHELDAPAALHDHLLARERALERALHSDGKREPPVTGDTVDVVGLLRWFEALFRVQVGERRHRPRVGGGPEEHGFLGAPRSDALRGYR